MSDSNLKFHQYEDENLEQIDNTITTIEIEETEAGNVSQIQLLDLSKITGRNLITGQTVTLHTYMDKLQKKLKTHNANKKNVVKRNQEKRHLQSLLDKKIVIGKTKSGKSLVGKIIHVDRKNNETMTRIEETEGELVINEMPSEVPENLTANEMIDHESESDLLINLNEDPKLLIRKSAASMDAFKEISKTLGGVMEMESVREKLVNKNMVVKFIEKKYVEESDDFIKNTSYSYGYMENETSEDDNGFKTDRWKFVLDPDTQDALLWEHADPAACKDNEKPKTTKFSITTSLTISVTYGKDGHKTIRVNLNPAPGNLCSICAKSFENNLQLRLHMNAAHNTFGHNTICEICKTTFDSPQKLQKHKLIHIAEGKLFVCSECNKGFTTQNRLQKHLPMHDLYLKPLECSVCEVRCSGEWAMKKHLLTHTGIKPFACDICQKQFLSQYDVNFHKKTHFAEKNFSCNVCLRTFSRHSNLLRHIEIHKGSGALYK